MSFDLAAPEPSPAEVTLAPGLVARIRPLTGMLMARADAEIAGIAADVRSGAAAASRFGLDAGELTDRAALTGLPDFARLVVLGALTIASWTVTRSGESVAVTEAAVAELFNKVPEVQAAFRNHLYAAAAERLDAGNAYASSLSTISGEEASTAEGAPGSPSPAAEASPPPPESSAQSVSSPRAIRRRQRSGARSAATQASGAEPEWKA